MGIKKFWKKKIWKKFSSVKCHLRLLGRQKPLGGIGASNATQGHWGVKCHLGVSGRQMPLGGIGASNATRGYWGVKCHLGIMGESKATRASKGRRQGSWGVKDWGVRDQGRQGSGGGSGVKIPASGFMSSKVPGVKGDESTLRISKILFI